jgi:hypothetical protein
MDFIFKISILCLINLISMVLSAPTTTIQITSDTFENDSSTSTKQSFSSPEALSFLPITSSTSSPVLISTTTIQPSIVKSTDPIASASTSTTTTVTSIQVTSSTAVENVNVLSLFAINNNNYNPENEIINDDDDDYLQYYYLYYL